VTPRQGVTGMNKASKVAGKLVKESFGFVYGIRGLGKTLKEVVTGKGKSLVSGMSSFRSDPFPHRRQVTCRVCLAYDL
jgi:hypothetical protein